VLVDQDGGEFDVIAAKEILSIVTKKSRETLCQLTSCVFESKDTVATQQGTSGLHCGFTKACLQRVVLRESQIKFFFFFDLTHTDIIFLLSLTI